jgi:hypothetical protein
MRRGGYGKRKRQNVTLVIKSVSDSESGRIMRGLSKFCNTLTCTRKGWRVGRKAVTVRKKYPTVDATDLRPLRCTSPRLLAVLNTASKEVRKWKPWQRSLDPHGTRNTGR